MVKVENNISSSSLSTNLENAIEALSKIITEESVLVILSGTIGKPQMWTNANDPKLKQLIEALFRLNYWK